MNIRLAHKLIAEAEAQQPHGWFKVQGSDLVREVQEMAEAGLVKTTQPQETQSNEAVITRITHAGHQFYRALNNVRSFAHN